MRHIPLENDPFVVLDTEANSLKPDKVWIVGWTYPDGTRREFYPEDFYIEGAQESGWHNEYKEECRRELQALIDAGVYIIGHNIIAYDCWVLETLFGVVFNYARVCDTMVLSQVLRPTTPKDEAMASAVRALGCDTREGGHGLKAWGKRLGDHKGDFDPENFAKGCTEEMLIYWRQDLALNLKVFLVLRHEFLTYEFTELCIAIEHTAQYNLALQTRNGFKLDRDQALRMRDEVIKLRDHAISELQGIFPPKRIDIETKFAPMVEVAETVEETSVYKTGPKAGQTKITNRKTGAVKTVMHGGFARRLENNLWEQNEDGSYTFYEWQEFNPGSPEQVAERLLELGWKPKKYTKGGQASVSKVAIQDAINDLKAQVPQVALLAKYGILDDRLSLVTKWLELAEEDGKVHGSVRVTGAWTHRCSHFSPNSANFPRLVPKTFTLEEFTEREQYFVESFEKWDTLPTGSIFLGHNEARQTVDVVLAGYEGDFGWECRSCWIAEDPKNNILVGVDAASIQLRALAHYMEDPEYAKEVCDGDIHIVNMNASGCPNRNTAKTFIYAWLLGAGPTKIGSIIGVADLVAAKELVEKNKGLARQAINSISYKGETPNGMSVAQTILGKKTMTQFLDNIPALKRLKQEVIPQIAKRGFHIGLDGRKIWVESEHLCMGALLQGFEAVVMKLAMNMYSDKLRKKDIWFKQRAFVHDEFVVECNKEDAEEVRQTMMNAIVQAGVVLKSNCPLGADGRADSSWAKIH